MASQLALAPRDPGEQGWPLLGIRRAPKDGGAVRCRNVFFACGCHGTWFSTDGLYLPWSDCGRPAHQNLEVIR